MNNAPQKPYQTPKLEMRRIPYQTPKLEVHGSYKHIVGGSSFGIQDVIAPTDPFENVVNPWDGGN
jgi:hypothetical protein